MEVAPCQDARCPPLPAIFPVDPPGTPHNDEEAFLHPPLSSVSGEITLVIFLTRPEAIFVACSNTMPGTLHICLNPRQYLS